MKPKKGFFVYLILLIAVLQLPLAMAQAISITYNNVTNTITCTGGTALAPITFWDIWNASNVNGWGVVSKQGDTQFLLQCRLYVGDGSTETHFMTKQEQIVFESSGLGAGASLLRVNANAYFTSGILVSEAKRQGKLGSSFTFIITDLGDISTRLDLYAGTSKIYASQFICIDKVGIGIGVVTWVYPGNSWLFQVTFTGFRDLISGPMNAQNLLWTGNLATEYIYFTPGSEYLWFFGSTLADIYSPPDESTAKPPLRKAYFETLNTWSRAANYIGGIQDYLGPLPFPIPIWAGTPVLGCQIKWYASVDLKVIDVENNPIENVTVTLKNKDGIQQFSVNTTADGKISEKAYVVKDEWSGTGSTNNRTDYNDFTLKLSYPSYQTYETEITLYKGVNWVIAMGDPPADTIIMSGTGVIMFCFIILVPIIAVMVAKR